MCLGHHLSEDDLVSLIRNVGDSAGVHRPRPRSVPAPLALFRLFVAPFLCRIGAEDGQRSIRRSYTPLSFEELGSALAGHRERLPCLSRIYVRQVMDISYANTPGAAVRSAYCEFISGNSYRNS
jgi:hypothetical protein